jgi:hypothetical protein
MSAYNAFIGNCTQEVPGLVSPLIFPFNRPLSFDTTWECLAEYESQTPGGIGSGTSPDPDLVAAATASNATNNSGVTATASAFGGVMPSGQAMGANDVVTVTRTGGSASSVRLCSGWLGIPVGSWCLVGMIALV